MAAFAPDLVISAGFLKLVGARFLDAFGGRYIDPGGSKTPGIDGLGRPAG